ncbi:hypothetical protein [Bacteroides sp.]|uniref:hypothetical protein n=1 Tax=Bacteroides sp. TaxID=29523 RepID=UPI00261D7B94|nr:hypothetical protein [Bacteroides sp.]MDD3040884.1 hypothetical protein [Bacteroides sp.]
MKLIDKKITAEFDHEELTLMLENSFDVLKWILGNNTIVPASVQIAAADLREFMADLYNLGTDSEN